MMEEIIGIDSEDIITVAKTYFPDITLNTFYHVFKLQADTVAHFLQAQEKVLIFECSSIDIK